MIILVFMTDKKRVVGGSSFIRNLIRMPFLPIRELSRAMDKIMTGQHIVMGTNSTSFYASKASNYDQAYVLTRDQNYQSPNESLKVCHDLQSLVKRYQHSTDDLLVIGGHTMWKLFLPYADQLRIAETHSTATGDLVFSEWEDGTFEVVNIEQGKKVSVLYYTRSSPSKAETPLS